MDRETVMDLIDELRIVAEKTVLDLERFDLSRNGAGFEDHAQSFYSWLIFNLRPNLYNALHAEEVSNK